MQYVHVFEYVQEYVCMSEWVQRVLFVLALAFTKLLPQAEAHISKL